MLFFLNGSEFRQKLIGTIISVVGIESECVLLSILNIFNRSHYQYTDPGNTTHLTTQVDNMTLIC